MKTVISSSALWNAFLEEAHLQSWAPVYQGNPGERRLTVRSIADLLHCPMADTLAFLPLNAKENEGVSRLCLAIFSVLGITDYLMLFLDQGVVDAYSHRLVSRTSAHRVLSFGVDAHVNDACYIRTENLLEVLTNPILKRKIWSDVSKIQI